MKLSSVSFSDESSLKRLFTWQTKNGAAPRFGSRPIGWYEQHQIHAFDIINATAKNSSADEVKFQKGNLMLKVGGRWQLSGLNSLSIFTKADELCRPV